MSRIAKRYGRALFNLAGGDLAKAKRQLASLSEVRLLFDAKTMSDSAKVLVSPVMPTDLKKSLLDYALKKSGADQEVQHFFDAIIEGGRVAFVPKIIDSIAELIDDAEGVARAEVAAAVPLKAGEVAEIGKSLGKLINKNVSVSATVDPSLLGGFVAHVGNYRVDMSLKTRLEGLSQNAINDTVR